MLLLANGLLAWLCDANKYRGIAFVRPDADFPFGAALAPHWCDRQHTIAMPLFVDHEEWWLHMRIDAFADWAIQVSLAATDSYLFFGDKRRDVEFFFHVYSLVRCGCCLGST